MRERAAGAQAARPLRCFPGGVRRLLRPSDSGGELAPIHPRSVERQASQVDAADGRGPHLGCEVSVAPALHRASQLGLREGLGSTPSDAPRRSRPAAHRQHRFFQAREPLGWCRPAVFRHARQGRQLPDRRRQPLRPEERSWPRGTTRSRSRARARKFSSEPATIPYKMVRSTSRGT